MNCSSFVVGASIGLNRIPVDFCHTDRTSIDDFACSGQLVGRAADGFGGPVLRAKTMRIFDGTGKGW
jgi:hypothetical protein